MAATRMPSSAAPPAIAQAEIQLHSSPPRSSGTAKTAAGTQATRTEAAICPAFISSTGGNQVLALSTDMTELWRSGTDAFSAPRGISIDPDTDTIWIADSGDHQLVRLDWDGTESYRSPPSSYMNLTRVVVGKP